MKRSTVEAEITRLLADDLFDGDTRGIDPTTPLFEYDLIDDVGVQRLITAVEARWAIALPAAEVTRESVADVRSLAALVMHYAKR